MRQKHPIISVPNNLMLQVPPRSRWSRRQNIIDIVWEQIELFLLNIHCIGFSVDLRMHSAAVRKTCSRIIFARKQQNVNVYKLPNICVIECGDKKGMLKPLQRRDSWIRDGGGDRLSNVHPPLCSTLCKPSPAATLISHNYLGCAGVALGGAIPPHYHPNSPSIFGGKSMRLESPH